MVVDFDFSIIEGFDWDRGNLEHIEKHNAIYTECEEIFSNRPFLVNEDETHSTLEKRFQALGQTNKGRLLFITFTLRKSLVRVIYARDQDRKERIKLKEIRGEKE